MKRSSTSAHWMRFGARAVLVIVALFWFVFALLSGAESQGGGLSGIVRNAPNALPWALLLAAVLVALRRERLGAVLVLAFVAWFVVFFNAWRSPVLLLAVGLPLVAACVALIVVSRLDSGGDDAG